MKWLKTLSKRQKVSTIITVVSIIIGGIIVLFYDEKFFSKAEVISGIRNTAKINYVDKQGNYREVFSQMAEVQILSPVVFLKINGGSSYTSSPNTTLTVTSTDVNMKFMRFSNDNLHWTNWLPFSSPATYSWVIINPKYGGTSSPGIKTVYVGLTDTVSRELAYYQISATISFQTAEPTPTPID